MVGWVISYFGAPYLANLSENFNENGSYGMQSAWNAELVGGLKTSWKIWKSMGRIIPYIMENKKCLKPPTSEAVCDTPTATTWHTVRTMAHLRPKILKRCTIRAPIWSQVCVCVHWKVPSNPILLIFTERYPTRAKHSKNGALTGYHSQYSTPSMERGCLIWTGLWSKINKMTSLGPPF